MKLLNKTQPAAPVNEITLVNPETPVVVPNGALVIINSRVYRAESYGLVEVVYQYLPLPTSE